MQLLEFAQRFLNYKAYVSIRNAQTGKVEFTGMFMDCPYRYCKFSNVARCEVDTELNILVIYVLCNSSMYYNTTSHFIDAG